MIETIAKAIKDISAAIPAPVWALAGTIIGAFTQEALRRWGSLTCRIIDWKRIHRLNEDKKIAYIEFKIIVHFFCTSGRGANLSTIRLELLDGSFFGKPLASIRVLSHNIDDKYDKLNGVNVPPLTIMQVDMDSQQIRDELINTIMNKCKRIDLVADYPTGRKQFRYTITQQFQSKEIEYK